MTPDLSVQDVLGAAGEPPRVVADGKTYTVGFPTQRAKARLEELVAASAVAAVADLKAALPPAAYAEQWAEVKELIRRREYRTGGSLWAEAMAGPGGGVLFLLALLRECHPDATEADARRLLAAAPEQVEAALARVTPVFIRAVAADLGATRDQTEAALKRLTPSAPTASSAP